jgi:hypothetical protein
MAAQCLTGYDNEEDSQILTEGMRWAWEAFPKKMELG